MLRVIRGSGAAVAQPATVRGEQVFSDPSYLFDVAAGGDIGVSDNALFRVKPNTIKRAAE
jgi:hypothetical protein